MEFEFRKIGMKSLLASGTLIDDNFIIDFVIISGPAGPFVSLPNQKYEDKKTGKTHYKNVVRINRDKEGQQNFQNYVLAEAQKAGVL